MDAMIQKLFSWKTIDYFNKTMGCYNNSDKILGILCRFAKLLISSDANPSFEAEVRMEFQKIMKCIQSLEVNVVSEMKGEPHRTLIAKLETMKNRFEVIISSNRDAPAIRFLQLDDFITKMDNEDFECNLVNLLDSKMFGSKSFLDAFIEKIEFNQRSINTQDVKNAPQKMVFDLFLFMLDKVTEANTLHCIALCMKHDIDGTLDDMNLENIEKRLQIAITSLKTKINIAFENFSTVDGRIYHPPFVPEDKRILGGVQVTPLATPRGGGSYSISWKMFLHDSPVSVSRPGCVVTGARFVRQEPDSRTCHYFLNLQSARLLPFGLIDQATLEWEPLPTTDSFTPVSHLATGCKNFSDTNIVITGGKFIMKKVKRNYQVMGMFWDTQETLEVASLQIVGRRFNFETGEIYEENFSLNLLEENSIVDFSSKTMVKEEVAIFNIIHGSRDSWSLSMYAARLSSSTVTSKFPVAAINLMSNSYEGFRWTPHYESKEHLCLYLKSLDYEKLSQN